MGKANSLKRLEASRIPHLAKVLKKRHFREEVDGKGRFYRAFDDGLKLYRLTSNDGDRVREVRQLFAERIRESDVESEDTILKFLSEFAQGRAHYVLRALYDVEGNLIGGDNTVIWPEIETIQKVLIAVKEKTEGTGYGWLLATELLRDSLGVLANPRYIFAEMEPKIYTMGRIARWSAWNMKVADIPYPLPPLQKGGEISWLVPGILPLRKGDPDTFINKEDLKKILFHIQESFYGTVEYIGKSFKGTGEKIELFGMKTKEARKWIINKLVTQSFE